MNKKYNTYVNMTFSTADEYDNISHYEEKIASDAYRDYRRKWLENPKNLIIGEGPLHIDVEITDFCNLKCKMCPRSVHDIHNNSNDTFMSFDLLKDIVDEARDLDVLSIKFGIVSEPLSHPMFYEMVKYANEIGFEDIAVITNGTLLNESLSKKIIEAGLTKINISFDSPVKETYESIRRGADFYKTIANIKKLIEIRDSMNSPTPLLRVTMVKLDENKNERQLFYETFKPFADRIAYLDYVEYNDDALLDYSILNNKIFDNYVCAQLWQRLSIDENGLVYPCCGINRDEAFSWDFKQYGLKSIWQNKSQELRNNFINNTWKEIPMCRRCVARVRGATLKDGKV